MSRAASELEAIDREVADLRHRIEALRFSTGSDEDVIGAVCRREASLGQLRWLARQVQVPLRAVILRVAAVRQSCANHSHRLWTPSRPTEIAIAQCAIPMRSTPPDRWTRALDREPTLSRATLECRFKPAYVDIAWTHEVELFIVQRVISGPDCVAERQLVEQLHSESSPPRQATAWPTDRQRQLTLPLADLLHPAGMLGYDLTHACPAGSHR